MKLSQFCLLLTSLVLSLIIITGCHPSPRELTLVSGKTVYGELALEDVVIEISRWEQSGWEYLSDTRSGYHGSFRLHLPPGTYLLLASKTVRMGDEDVPLSGALENLVVKEGGGRMDQIVILMNRSK